MQYSSYRSRLDNIYANKDGDISIDFGNLAASVANSVCLETLDSLDTQK